MIAEGPGIVVTLIAFVIVIATLVFVHELGHYLVGRWFGVKADKFSIGFGKEIAGWTDSRGTRWKVGALPLGGYVQFAGDMDASSRPAPGWRNMPPEEVDHTFPAQPLWKRAAIVFAGPAVNFLFAIAILTGFVMFYGENVTPSEVGRVLEGSPAAEMGIAQGDRITAINGREVETFNGIVRAVSTIPGGRAEVTVERGGRTIALEGRVGVHLERDRFGNEYRFGRLGVGSIAPERRNVPFYEAPVVATRQTGNIVGLIFETLGQIISGRRSVKELGGPLKIAQVSGEQFSAGLSDFIFFVALISINLGFINLLPIPMLDGGHLLMYGVEAVRRRPASPEVQAWAFRSGFAIVMAFMILVTFNDLSSFGLFGR